MVSIDPDTFRRVLDEAIEEVGAAFLKSAVNVVMLEKFKVVEAHNNLLQLQKQINELTNEMNNFKAEIDKSRQINKEHDTMNGQTIIPPGRA